MPPSTPQTALFQTRFRHWANRVRRRLLARRVLSGMAIGLVAAGAVAALMWWWRIDSLRPWAAAAGALGGVVGWALAMGARWSDEEVALFLDARLEGDESISTAVQLAPGEGDAARAVVLDRAATLLGEAPAARARPRVWRYGHMAALLGAGLVAWLSWIPLPATPPPPTPPPGAETVQATELAGLEKIVALERLEARDPEQRRRLDAIAKQARELREQLTQGVEKREALARIAKLRDEIAAEQMRFGDQRNRAGLAAAIRKLQSDPRLKGAAEALGNGDLTDFDREMQELANQAEEEDRDAAREALEEAEQAARDRGAQELADLLERQQQAFERQEARGEALRELARQLEDELGEDALEDLREFGDHGDPEAQRRLAEALEKALEGLTSEERQRLAERLQERLDDGKVQPLTKEQLEALKRQLEDDSGQQELEEMLRDLAKPGAGEDAQRQQGLDEAERGGADAQRQLGLVPVPSPGGPQSGGNPGDPRDGDPHGTGGPGEGGDEGNHEGKTERVEDGQLRAKARPRLDPSVPLRGGTLGRAPGGTGETANQHGTGALGQVGNAELESVERSEVPQEYREQVGRYFQP